MRSYPTENLNFDIDAYEADVTDWLNSRPKCQICDEPIQEEWCWVLTNDNYFYVCQECADNVEVLDDDLEKFYIS